MSSASSSPSSPQTMANVLSVMITEFGSSTVNVCSDSAKSHQAIISARTLRQLPTKSLSSSPSQHTMSNFLSDLISEFGSLTVYLCSDSAKSHQPSSSKTRRQLSSKSCSTKKVDNRWSSSNEQQQSIPQRSSPNCSPTPRKSSRISRCALRRPSSSYHPKVQKEQRHQRRQKHSDNLKASPIGLPLRNREKPLLAERVNIIGSTAEAIPAICSVAAKVA
jgi:hypothetical protein